MLIHPGDGAISETEWRDWLAGHDFGQLAVNDPEGGRVPLAGPRPGHGRLQVSGKQLRSPS
jgi:transcriptional regulator